MLSSLYAMLSTLYAMLSTLYSLLYFALLTTVMPEYSAGFRLQHAHRNPKQNNCHRLPSQASARNSDIPTCSLLVRLSIPSSPPAFNLQSPCCFELRGLVRPCLVRFCLVRFCLVRLCLSGVRLWRVRSPPMLLPRMPKTFLR